MREYNLVPWMVAQRLTGLCWYYSKGRKMVGQMELVRN